MNRNTGARHGDSDSLLASSGDDQTENTEQPVVVGAIALSRNQQVSLRNRLGQGDEVSLASVAASNATTPSAHRGLVQAEPVMEAQYAEPMEDMQPVNVQGPNRNRIIFLVSVTLLLFGIIAVAVGVPLAKRSSSGEAAPTGSLSFSPEPTVSPSFSPAPSRSFSFSPSISPSLAPTWQSLRKEPNGKAADDRFGQSISLSRTGSVMAVGADQPLPSGSGYVSVFQYNAQGQVWTPVGQDLFGEANGDHFGFSVSLNGSGTRLAVGAYGNDQGGSDAGHVRVYEYNTTSSRWNQLGSDIVGQASGDRFGWSVSMSDMGDALAVGAVLSDATGAGEDSGTVLLLRYNRNKASWDPWGQTLSGTVVGDNFGHSVSMSGSGAIVAISAIGSINLGFGTVLVHQYNPTSSKWVQMGRPIYQPINPGFEFYGDFGSSVSLASRGLVVAVGDSGSSEGVHVFEFSSTTSEWMQRGETIVHEGNDDDFGQSVSLGHDGNMVAVGVPRRDVAGLTDSGQVRIYQYDSSAKEWKQVGENINGNAADDVFGWSVATAGNGTVVGIGAAAGDRNGMEATGYVKVFTLN